MSTADIPCLPQIPRDPALNFDAVLASFDMDLIISLSGQLKVLGLILLSNITTHLSLDTLLKGLGLLQILNMSPFHYSNLDSLCWLLSPHSVWSTQLAQPPLQIAQGRQISDTRRLISSRVPRSM